MQAKQKDKQAVGQLEKRLKAEQEARGTAEKQLADEKKRKKLEEATAARAVALAAASRLVLIRHASSPLTGEALICYYNGAAVGLSFSEGSAQTRCGDESAN